MEHFIAHFQEYLITGLILALFFKETVTELVVAFFNKQFGMKKKEKIPEWADRLTQYANHDTTSRLNELIEMEKEEHKEAQSMRDTLKNVEHSLGNIEKYGVKIRKS